MVGGDVFDTVSELQWLTAREPHGTGRNTIAPVLLLGSHAARRQTVDSTPVVLVSISVKFSGVPKGLVKHDGHDRFIAEIQSIGGLLATKEGIVMVVSFWRFAPGPRRTGNQFPQPTI